MTPPIDLIPIIREIALAFVVIIGAWTAFKVKIIEHNVNSAASQAAADNKALTAEVAALKADKAAQKETAAVLAARAEPVKRKS